MRTVGGSNPFRERCAPNYPLLRGPVATEPGPNDVAPALDHISRHSQAREVTFGGGRTAVGCLMTTGGSVPAWSRRLPLEQVDRPREQREEHLQLREEAQSASALEITRAAYSERCVTRALERRQTSPWRTSGNYAE
jgi:hypothetical protein